MSRKEGKTCAVNFGKCANIGENISEGRNLERGSVLPRMVDSKHAKIVKHFVNGDKNQVNLENTVRCTCIYRGRYCREQASESAHAIRDDSGAISANVRTVAKGRSVSGVGIGES